jgi:hypothetical protein
VRLTRQLRIKRKLTNCFYSHFIFLLIFYKATLSFKRALDIADSNENLCGPVGPRSDITSKSGFFVSLFESNGELRRFLRCNAGGI